MNENCVHENRWQKYVRQNRKLKFCADWKRIEWKNYLNCSSFVENCFLLNLNVCKIFPTKFTNFSLKFFFPEMDQMKWKNHLNYWTKCYQNSRRNRNIRQKQSQRVRLKGISQRTMATWAWMEEGRNLFNCFLTNGRDFKKFLGTRFAIEFLLNCSLKLFVLNPKSKNELES